MTVDYSDVTEAPGNSVSREALSMLYTRYRFAAQFCAGKDVLEVACGPGAGLGYLATIGRVIGGDFTENLLRRASRHYRGRIPLLRLDAHALPFPDASFDVLLLYEAIYYLKTPERFLAECRRVLRDGGIVILCTANKELAGFNPSPFSTRYFSVSELCEFLTMHRFAVEPFGAFSVPKGSARDAVISWIRRTAVALGIIPKTMKGKAVLKRVFLGPLNPVPAEITGGMAPYWAPVPVSATESCATYKVIFAVARPL